MTYSIEEIEIWLQEHDNTQPATIIQDLLDEYTQACHDRDRRKEPIIIEYFTKEVYGRRLEYIKDPTQRKIIECLCRQKTIDSIIRELLRDLTHGAIIFKEVLP